ncbi:hypothetical protein GGR56DRAFT_674322 [Xylariaceae sp. FL0804]|nr:hypothetical protein GGR56DRAFT_674322 [Xylariaceae sp. FL0804]
MGLLPLSYRRPHHVDEVPPPPRSSHGDFSGDEKSTASLNSGRSGHSSGIPDALNFDKIMNGGTCPPCTIRDFMNYLIYIEHSAENLQFFLWYRDYVKRFKESNTADIGLAPQWTQAMEEETAARVQREAVEKMKRVTGAAAAMFRGTDFGRTGEGREPLSPATADSASLLSGSLASTQRTSTQDAFTAAGAKQPFTIQPFRSEIGRVIATYLAEDAPRQLNLSAREQKAVMLALSYTTHPSALDALARNIENTLRRQAHPNFIRWTICNGNAARVWFARGLGVVTTWLSTVAAVILTLSHANRGWRALPAIGWIIGISTLAAAVKGMCVVLHGLHHRHLRPWELFADSDDDEPMTKASFSSSFDSFGSANSYEDRPWVVRYDRRNLVRKVFDREVWIQEPALRQIQDTIFVQSILIGVLAACSSTTLLVHCRDRAPRLTAVTLDHDRVLAIDVHAALNRRAHPGF